jgi:hypothetical protein
VISTNESAEFGWTSDANLPLIDERLHAGLAVLWRAYICAQDVGANLHDLALPAKRLHEAGMTRADLHWLVTKGLANYREQTTASPAARAFPSNGLDIDHLSRLILTARGAALAKQVFSGNAQSTQAMLLELTPNGPANRKIAVGRMPAVKPRWDTIRRELSLAGSIIKRFRVPARNQETILAVFEEEGWAEHIQDPLPVTQDIDAPTRLHDAINRLNRCQINRLVRFHGDGNGTGIFWELCSDRNAAG